MVEQLFKNVGAGFQGFVAFTVYQEVTSPEISTSFSPLFTSVFTLCREEKCLSEYHPVTEFRFRLLPYSDASLAPLSGLPKAF